MWSQQRTFVMTGSAVQIAQQSDRRTAIILGCASATSLELSMNPGFATNDGLQIFQGTYWLEMTLQSHGDLVRKAWFAIGAIGTNATVIEAYSDSFDEARKPVRPATPAGRASGNASREVNPYMPTNVISPGVVRRLLSRNFRQSAARVP